MCNYCDLLKMSTAVPQWCHHALSSDYWKLKLTSNLIGHLGPPTLLVSFLDHTFDLEPTKFKVAAGASLGSKVKCWTVRGCVYKAIAYIAVFPGMCHSSTRPVMSYHVTQLYQAFPRVSNASDKRWGEKAWVQGYITHTSSVGWH